MDSSVSNKPTTIRAIIFDLDGTLLDTESLSSAAVIDSFEKISLPLPPNIRNDLRQQGDLLPWGLKRRILGLRGSEWVPLVLAYAQEHWDVEMELDWRDGWQSRCSGINEKELRVKVINRFWTAWEERCNELCADVTACPGAPELVESLRLLNLPLAIATSSRSASVEVKCCKHEYLFQAFQAIVTGDDKNVKNGKPAPDIYIEAAKRLGFHPSECLVFEDAVTGVQAGKAAGCHVVAVPDHRLEKEVFRSIADEVLTNLWEFSGKRWGISLEMAELHVKSSSALDFHIQ